MRRRHYIWDGSNYHTALKMLPSVIYVPNYSLIMTVTTSVPREGCTTAFSFDFFSSFADCVYYNSGTTCGGGINIWDGSKSHTALKFVPSVIYVPIYSLTMTITTSVPREGCTTSSSFDFFHHLRIVYTIIQVRHAEAALIFGTDPSLTPPSNLYHQ
jgi:hypothetical protein